MSGEFEHIGDGIYITYDGTRIVLNANSHDNPTDTVYLEREVFITMITYLTRIGYLCSSCRSNVLEGDEKPTRYCDVCRNTI